MDAPEDRRRFLQELQKQIGEKNAELRNLQEKGHEYQEVTDGILPLYTDGAGNITLRLNAGGQELLERIAATVARIARLDASSYLGGLPHSHARKLATLTDPVITKMHSRLERMVIRLEGGSREKTMEVAEIINQARTDTARLLEFKGQLHRFMADQGGAAGMKRPNSGDLDSEPVAKKAKVEEINVEKIKAKKTASVPATSSDTKQDIKIEKFAPKSNTRKLPPTKEWARGSFGALLFGRGASSASVAKDLSIYRSSSPLLGNVQAGNGKAPSPVLGGPRPRTLGPRPTPHLEPPASSNRSAPMASATPAARGRSHRRGSNRPISRQSLRGVRQYTPADEKAASRKQTEKK